MPNKWTKNTYVRGAYGSEIFTRMCEIIANVTYLTKSVVFLKNLIIEDAVKY